jgi:hypothetical protein
MELNKGNNMERGLYSKKPHLTEYKDRDRTKHILAGSEGSERLECPRGYRVDDILMWRKGMGRRFFYCPACCARLVMGKSLLDYTHHENLDLGD